MRAHASIEIDANTSEVWLELSDLASHVAWINALETLDFVSDDHRGEGVVFDVEVGIGPLKVKGRMTVDRWDTGVAISVVQEGSVPGNASVVLTQRGNRTRLSWDEHFELPWWLGGTAGAFATRWIRSRAMRRDLARFRIRVQQRNPTTEDEPDAVVGSLVGSGRHGDVHDFGRNRVIRRNRNRASLSAERDLMKWVFDHGYPVPRVHEHPDETAIVMDRVDGPSMLDDLTARPWKLGEHAHTLAQLHELLDQVPVPPDRLAFKGEGLVHLDLHPGNILLSSDGPMVINWANAGVGQRGLDRAMTWVLMKTDNVEGNLAYRGAILAVRERIARRYRDAVGADVVSANATNAAELRMLDANLRRDEADAVFRLARSLQNRPTHSRTDDV
ncbi:MAG: phosphotransferase [Actinomycetia bacterium]|nr:phosphotransferase [Actinomycetes bacterium]MCP4959447.1 phosphotransferase [Actinomycetes bacterium]